MKPYVPVLLVAVGGALGALARYGLTGLNQPSLPAGTWVVNIAGCFVMGLLARWLETGIASPELRLALGIGFLGALTTFSTFSYELLVFLQTRSYLAASAYTLLSVAGALLAVIAGHRVAMAVWR